MKSNIRIRPPILAALSLSSSALSFLSASSFSSLSLFSSIFFSSFLLKYEAKKLSLRDSQSLNAPSPIFSNLSHSERFVFTNCLHPRKAFFLIEIMLLGNITFFKESHPEKALFPITSSFVHSERSTVSTFLQPEYLEVIDYQLFVVNTVEKWIGCYLWVYGK